VTAPWWAAFGPAEASLSCGSGQHGVRWAEGVVQALDHADAEGESVLAALGGGTTPCIDLLRAWSTHADDLRVLAIGPRSEKDTLTITNSVVNELVSPPSGWTGSAPHSRAARAALIRTQVTLRSTSGGRVFGYGGIGRLGRQYKEPASTGLLRLLALGMAFQLRLSGSVAHAWSAGGPHAGDLGRARPKLTAALAGRVAPAAARWLGIDPGQVEATLHDGPGWGEICPAGPAEASRVHARLPVSWLATVWAPGLAVVGGHLVVSVQHAAWPTAHVLAVQAPGRPPVELSVRHGQRAWTISSAAN
jgi:hypothetical protein